MLKIIHDIWVRPNLNMSNIDEHYVRRSAHFPRLFHVSLQNISNRKENAVRHIPINGANDIYTETCVRN